MISVIICTYNRCNSLKATLKSIAEMIMPSEILWELIIVDNNSTDNTRSVVMESAETIAAPVRYILETRQGLSYARNAGISQACGDIIAFTDDDVTVDRHWLASLAEGFKKFECAAIGGKVVSVWPSPKPAWYVDAGPFASPKAIVSFDLGDQVCSAEKEIIGANMAFRRSVFSRYGLFRTDIGRTKGSLAGGEDIDFFRRIKTGGESVLFLPTAAVSHPVAEERTHQAYFQSWCFHGARSQVRLEGVPKGVYYWGIPRYLLRDFIENFLKWFVSVEPKRRFYYKLQLFIIAGTITETRRLRQAGAGFTAL